MAELWPAKVFEWRQRVCTVWLTAAQVDWCIKCFSSMPDRVEILVSSWSRCIDIENIWIALYNLSVCCPSRCRDLLHSHHLLLLRAGDHLKPMYRELGRMWQ